ALVGGIGRFDDDVAAEVGGLATVVAVADVEVGEGPVQRQARAGDLAKDALLGLALIGPAREGRARRGDKELVADAPAAHGLGQGDDAVALAGVGTEL